MIFTNFYDLGIELAAEYGSCAEWHNEYLTSIFYGEDENVAFSEACSIVLGLTDEDFNFPIDNSN